MKEQQKQLMSQLLRDSNTPALSFAWYQQEKKVVESMAFGRADALSANPVDTNTLFQAASLSKPVSAAIILDLIKQETWDQEKWNLDTPLADIADYGPLELRQDSHYRILTTRMVIGQCSGLANYGQDGDDGKKFIAPPNTRFTYSGVALDFLKQLIEQQTKLDWETIAQDFFKKANMKHSTFQRLLPDSRLNGIDRTIAKAHMTIAHADGLLTPLPSEPDDGRGVLAGAMLTNAEDYFAFLQYCFNNDYLKSTLLTGFLSTLPPTISPETSHIEWGLGMGIYHNCEPEQTIAFHWGNNTGSISFCAMNMATGDCVVCFSNSMNGPTVFQLLANPIVGDITPLFQWLSSWCFFKDVNQVAQSVATTVESLYLLAGSKPNEFMGSMHKMLLLMPSQPEEKKAQSEPQLTDTRVSTSQRNNEDNEQEKTCELKPTLFSISPDPYN